MKKTIFISSTFEDLKNYRRNIWDLLEKYEVNIRGMERFGARSEAPLQTCLAEVEQSDIFLGIIAYKLGSIDQNSGKSFIQREYERAYELDREILIYLIDEKNAKVAMQDIDFDEKREKLLSFKSILKERHTVDFFVSEEDLKTKLSRRFKEVLESTQRTEEEPSDEYALSKDVIDRFLLLPKKYTGSEVKLRVDFDGTPFPASKAICNSFNLDYGRTIGIPIKLKAPQLTTKFVNYLFVNEDNLDDFFALSVKSDIETYAKLEWTENDISEVRANFVRKVYTTQMVSPYSILPTPQGNYGFETRVVEAEGIIIALLTEFA